jgi:hypothetical protein
MVDCAEFWGNLYIFFKYFFVVITVYVHYGSGEGKRVLMNRGASNGSWAKRQRKGKGRARW